jgi:hypothetical protein
MSLVNYSSGSLDKCTVASESLAVAPETRYSPRVLSCTLWLKSLRIPSTCAKLHPPRDIRLKIRLATTLSELLSRVTYIVIPN